MLQLLAFGDKIGSDAVRGRHTPKTRKSCQRTLTQPCLVVPSGSLLAAMVVGCLFLLYVVKNLCFIVVVVVGGVSCASREGNAFKRIVFWL